MTQAREVIKALRFHEAFDDDVDRWFDLVSRTSDDAGLQDALKAAQGQPNERGWKAFKATIQRVGASQLRSMLMDTVRKIDAGDYDGEFQNQRIGRNSAVAELFSNFRQAMEG